MGEISSLTSLKILMIVSLMFSSVWLLVSWSVSVYHIGAFPQVLGYPLQATNIYK